MSKKYFGTDGIRGEVNKGNINGEMFFKFGFAAGTYFKNLRKNKRNLQQLIDLKFQSILMLYKLIF